MLLPQFCLMFFDDALGPICGPCRPNRGFPWDQRPWKWVLPGITRTWHHHYRWCSMKTKRAASIYPTVEEINALPEKFRQYIHDLVTRYDKSGDVQTIAILREDRDALRRRVEELEARIAQQEREYLEAPIETD